MDTESRFVMLVLSSTSEKIGTLIAESAEEEQFDNTAAEDDDDSNDDDGSASSAALRASCSSLTCIRVKSASHDRE